MKVDRLCIAGALWVMCVALAATVEAQPVRQRQPPWEIEPTEETKRRVDAGEGWDVPFDIALLAPRGKLHAYPLKIAPISMRTVDPIVARVHWKPGRKRFKLEGLTYGVTTLIVTYPAEAPEETEVIRYLVRVTEE